MSSNPIPTLLSVLANAGITLSQAALDVLEDPKNQVEFPYLADWQRAILEDMATVISTSADYYTDDYLRSKAIAMLGFARVLPDLFLSADTKELVMELTDHGWADMLDYSPALWTMSPTLLTRWGIARADNSWFYTVDRDEARWENDLRDYLYQNVELPLLETMIEYMCRTGYVHALYREVNDTSVISVNGCERLEDVLSEAGLCGDQLDRARSGDFFLLGCFLTEAVESGLAASALLPLVGHLAGLDSVNPVASANAVRALVAEPHLPVEWVVAAEDWSNPWCSVDGLLDDDFEGLFGDGPDDLGSREW